MDARNEESGEASQVRHKFASPNRDVHFVNRGRATWCAKWLPIPRCDQIPQAIGRIITANTILIGSHLQGLICCNFLISAP